MVIDVICDLLAFPFAMQMQGMYPMVNTARFDQRNASWESCITFNKNTKRQLGTGKHKGILIPYSKVPYPLT
jgi:hypothetical protein